MDNNTDTPLPKHSKRVELLVIATSCAFYQIIVFPSPAAKLPPSCVVFPAAGSERLGGQETTPPTFRRRNTLLHCIASGLSNWLDLTSPWAFPPIIEVIYPLRGAVWLPPSPSLHPVRCPPHSRRPLPPPGPRRGAERSGGARSWTPREYGTRAEVSEPEPEPEPHVDCWFGGRILWSSPLVFLVTRSRYLTPAVCLSSSNPPNLPGLIPSPVPTSLIPSGIISSSFLLAIRTPNSRLA